MELEIALTLLLLMVLSLLATVDMAFGQLSDVGLRRLIGENGEKPEDSRSRVFSNKCWRTARGSASHSRRRFKYCWSSSPS